MITNSRDIAKLLLQKMEDVSKGQNLSGADTLCRLAETFIKLSVVEIQYANSRNEMPFVPELINSAARPAQLPSSTKAH